MINFESVIIKEIEVAFVSNKLENKLLIASPFDLENEDEIIFVKSLLLKSFSNLLITSEFAHSIDLKFNVLFNISKEIYNGIKIGDRIQDITKHLSECSAHHNIKDGDLFIAKFDDILYNGKYYEGLGIYKFEDKDIFIETNRTNNKMIFDFKQGLGMKKPNKACLIIFTENPYTILVIDDNTGMSNYWQNDFINHKPKNDEINNTHNFLQLTKKFIVDELPNISDCSRAEQSEMLTSSVNYFKNNTSFNKDVFSKEIIGNDALVNSFKSFVNEYKITNDVVINDNFEISSEAVKKNQKLFKSILKLDKNFHIYIHGGKNNIEQGVEKDGRKFYKIYYQNES